MTAATSSSARAHAPIPPPIQVERASEEDAGEIARLLRRNAKSPTLILQPPSTVVRHIDDFVVVRGPDRMVVGCAQLHWHRPKVAEVMAVAVEPSRHGEGLGRVLVRACLERAMMREPKLVWLATTSPGYTTLAAGVYAWTASYNGDSNNSSAFSGCTAEEVTITPSSPALPTVPSAGGSIGTILNDTATVTGGTNPTGTVTFNLWGPDDVDCDGTAVYTQTVDLTAGSATTSPGYTTLAAGTYAWTASYSGDSNNNTASSGCTEEEVVIGKNTLSASTAQDLIPNDTLSLTGATTDAGGTVDFYHFAPNVTCSLANIANAAYTEEDVALTGDDDASTSNTGSGTGMYLATAEGTYTWLAIYSGDLNNNGATSDCVEQFTIDNDTTPTP